MNLPATFVLSLLQIFSLRDGCSPSDSLTVRNGHAMAFNDGKGVAMLFGGADERQVLGDLWAWDGNAWHCIASDGPRPRTFPSLAYDKSHDQLILFGGNSVLFGSERDTAAFLDDMWIWDGTHWRPVDTPTPSARAEAAMAYDAARRRVVLFGGYRNEGDERIRLGDTWEWDGRRWEDKQVTGPKPRNGASIAYDSDRRRIVLFGGSGNSGDTWAWDGTTWMQIASADTTPRFNAAMTFDAARRSIVRFGGWTREGRVRDTWQYDGIHWSKVADEGPLARNHSSLVYDGRRQVSVLFGGHDGDFVFGDTWEWNGQTWLQRTSIAPRLRIDNGH